ncbi:Rpn family recombination-promoting nuclease/putative transposase [Sorangium sp. So ce854]|uniref:Rpn family recombination-promoting nuclease/putative transposase n=1 Tax=Sorangium sp. So ce854 TaxID=3133322 RepID=UPI003F608F08
MTPTPHDALFKSTFSQPEHAAAALRQVLPAALAARIDFASLALQSGSFIDEKLAASHSDLLFSARLEEASLFIYVLFEHQSTARLLAAAGPEAEEEIGTIADYLREQGRLAGEREGRLEGQRGTLLKLLRQRFGELPEAVVARVRAADAGQLEGWTERVLTSPTLDDCLTER